MIEVSMGTAHQNAYWTEEEACERYWNDCTTAEAHAQALSDTMASDAHAYNEQETEADDIIHGLTKVVDEKMWEIAVLRQQGAKTEARESAPVQGGATRVVVQLNLGTSPIPSDWDIPAPKVPVKTFGTPATRTGCTMKQLTTARQTYLGVNPMTTKPLGMQFMTGLATPRETAETTPQPKGRQDAVVQHAMPKMGDNDSDSESDGEKATRIRTPVKPIELPAMPTTKGYRVRQEDAIAQLLAGSNRNKRRTLEHINQILNASSIQSLVSISKRWEEFDSELLLSTESIVDQRIHQNIILYCTQMRSEQRMPTGAAMMYLLTTKFDMNKGQLAQIDIQSILSHTWTGVLETHMSGLEVKLSQLNNHPSMDLLTTVVEAELRESREMDVVFQMYDMMDGDDPKKNIQWLCGHADKNVERIAKHANFISMSEAGDGATTMPVIPIIGADKSTEAWKEKMRAEVQARVKLTQGAAAKAKAEAGAKTKDSPYIPGGPNKGRGKEKGDGADKGRGKGKFKHQYEATERYAPCIYFLNGGGCAKDDCGFIHYDYMLPKPQRNHIPSTKHPAGTDLTKILNLKTMPCRHHLKGNRITDKECALGHDRVDAKEVEVVCIICMVSTNEKHGFANGGKVDVNDVRWALGTAAMHDVSGANIRAKTIEDEDLPNLGTAAGPYQPEVATEAKIKQLGDSMNEIVKLPDGSPSALSLERRCMSEGFEFSWDLTWKPPYSKGPMDQL